MQIFLSAHDAGYENWLDVLDDQSKSQMIKDRLTRKVNNLAARPDKFLVVPFYHLSGA